MEAKEPKKFYFGQKSEYERYSQATYGWILENFVKVERYVNEERKIRRGTWGLKKEEKIKLMYVLTAWGLCEAIAEFAMDRIKVHDRDWILELIKSENDVWKTIREVPLKKLQQLDKAEDALLVEKRLEEMLENFLWEHNTSDIYAESAEKYFAEIASIFGYKVAFVNKLRANQLDDIVRGIWQYREGEEPKPKGNAYFTSEDYERYRNSTDK